MTTEQAIQATGGLSNPSKMPGLSYALPAHSCPVGSRMRALEGSVCHDCYGCKGRYVFPVVIKAAERRLSKLQRDDWIDGMAHLISRDKCHDFRFHDTGDLQGSWHLDKIAEVARMLPERRIRLPTLEVKTVMDWTSHSRVPGNLFIRLSAPMVDRPVPEHYWKMLRDHKVSGFSRVSTMVEDVASPDELVCPATTVRKECGDCRACWERCYSTIVYKKH